MTDQEIINLFHVDTYVFAIMGRVIKHPSLKKFMMKKHGWNRKQWRKKHNIYIKHLETMNPALKILR